MQKLGGAFQLKSFNALQLMLISFELCTLAEIQDPQIVSYLETLKEHDFWLLYHAIKNKKLSLLELATAKCSSLGLQALKYLSLAEACRVKTKEMLEALEDGYTFAAIEHLNTRELAVLTAFEECPYEAVENNPMLSSIHAIAGELGYSYEEIQNQSAQQVFELLMCPLVTQDLSKKVDADSKQWNLALKKYRAEEIESLSPKELGVLLLSKCPISELKTNLLLSPIHALLGFFEYTYEEIQQLSAQEAFELLMQPLSTATLSSTAKASAEVSTSPVVAFSGPAQNLTNPTAPAKSVAEGSVDELGSPQPSALSTFSPPR